MKRYALRLSLMEDTIFTARSATAGAHLSLDYVPGAAIYGACAARIYADLKVAQQFDVFHSGKVRFGNGLPCDPAGEPALPMPFCWHTEKGKEPYVNHNKTQLDAGRIYNRIRGDKAVGKQLKQLRQGYVNRFGELYSPASTFRMKTAINPSTDTAAEAQLFGYAAIRAGQNFIAMLDIDDDRLGEAHSTQITDKLINAVSGNLRLGRSRSSQYGTVHCEVTEQTLESSAQIDCNTGLVLWLVSDVALRDKTYQQPTLTASPGSLGLPEQLEINWEKTFVRTRKYSPYNAKRRCHDQERQVLTQGSIICFEPKDIWLSPDDVDKLKRGIGDYRHSGLGNVLIQPELLVNNSIDFESRANLDNTCDKQLQAPESALLSWLGEVVDRGQRERQTRETALQLLEQLRKLYESAQAFAAADGGEFPGPGKSQWGRVMAAARMSTLDMNQALRSIAGKSQEGGESSGSIDADWSVETGLNHPDSSFAEWLLGNFGADRHTSDVLLILSNHALDLIDGYQSGKTYKASSTEIDHG